MTRNPALRPARAPRDLEGGMISFVESCPFCGGGFISLTKADEATGERRAFCEDCESTGPSAHTAEGALSLWNTRAPEEKAAA